MQILTVCTQESKEAYFVALRKKPDVVKAVETTEAAEVEAIQAVETTKAAKEAEAEAESVIVELKHSTENTP